MGSLPTTSLKTCNLLQIAQEKTSEFLHKPQNPAKLLEIHHSIESVEHQILRGLHIVQGSWLMSESDLSGSSSSTIWCPNSSLQLERQRCNATCDHLSNQSEAIQGSWIHQCREFGYRGRWARIWSVSGSPNTSFNQCQYQQMLHLPMQLPLWDIKKEKILPQRDQTTYPSDCSKTECKCNTCGGVGVKP